MRILFFLLLTATVSLAQAQQISGLAKDESGTPLSGATISLVRISDSSVVKLAVTKTNGAYNFSGINEGNYKVLGSFVGHKPTVSSVFTVGQSDVIVPELKFAKISGDMSNVTVTARKPMVEVKADKTILN